MCRELEVGAALIAGVAEAIDCAIFADHPVAVAAGCGCDADDWLAEGLATHRAVKTGVAEGEDATVGTHQPIAIALRPRGHADHWRVQVLTAHGTVERCAEGVDAAV